MLEHGKTEKQLLKDAYQWGLPVPDCIANPPVLGEGLGMFLDAFWRLTTCRQMGFGLGPIPWTAIQEYARINEFDDDHADDLEHHVMAMDSAYLAWSAKKQPESDKP